MSYVVDWSCCQFAFEVNHEDSGLIRFTYTQQGSTHHVLADSVAFRALAAQIILVATEAEAGTNG